MIEVRCPLCGKKVHAERDRDGYGRVKTAGPFRIGMHSGKRWGRTCKMSLEIHEPVKEK